MVGLATLGLGFGAGSLRAQTNGDQALLPESPVGHAAVIPPRGFAQDEVAGAPFTVRSVDKVNRTMVVAKPDGSRMTLEIAPAAVGFDELTKGESVQIDYYPSTVLAFEPTGASHAAGEAAWQKPISPADKTGREITTAAHITSIDRRTGTVEVLTRDGKPQALTFQSPALQSRPEALRPGAEVVVTFTEPVAVRVTAGQ